MGVLSQQNVSNDRGENPRKKNQMSEQKPASESPPSPSRCYATEVKEVVSRLLDLVVKTRFASLSVDTDEDCPWVRVWYRGKSINVYGNPMADRTTWISPEDSEDAESWSFVECCQRALAEAEKLE